MGKRLADIREWRGLSQADVEKITGGQFKKSRLGMWERGERNMNVIDLAALALVLGVTPESILVGEPDITRLHEGRGVIRLPH